MGGLVHEPGFKLVAIARPGAETLPARISWRPLNERLATSDKRGFKRDRDGT